MTLPNGRKSKQEEALIYHNVTNQKGMRNNIFTSGNKVKLYIFVSFPTVSQITKS